MIFKVTVDRSIGRIIVNTDDSSVKYMFESVIQDKMYIKGGWRNITKLIKIYDNKKCGPDENGLYVFVFHYGWASYLMRVFKGYLSVDDYNDLLKILVAETHRELPFPKLRDYQNEDVLYLLKYKIGLFSCFISYGEEKHIKNIQLK